MRKTYLEFIEGDSAKFWEAEIDGLVVAVRWGKLGTTGQTKTKSFDSIEAALQAADKMVSDKIKKGYVAGDSDAPEANTASKGRQVESSAPGYDVIKKWRQTTLTGFPFSHFRKKFADRQLRKELVQTLDKIDGGILVLTKLQGVDDLLALLAHPNAKSVKEIRFDLWSDAGRIETFAAYRDNEHRFKRETGLALPQLPDFLLDITYFFREIFSPEKTGIENRNYVSSNNNGLEQMALSSIASEILATAEIPHPDEKRKFLLANRYRFAPFNYLPLAFYESDSVTWGIYFDFKDGVFANSLGMSEDGLVGSYWGALLESMEEFLDGIEDFLDIAEPDEVEAECDMAFYWLYSRTLLGYLRYFGGVKTESDRPYELPKKEANGESFMFQEEPRFKVKLPADALSYTGKLTGRLESIFYASVRAIVLKSKETIFEENRAFDTSFDESELLRDLSHLMTNTKEENRLDSLLEVANKLCAAGCPWLVISACIRSWDQAANVADSKNIARLLDVVPDDQCPQFIKETALLHAETRYERQILMW